MIVFWTDGSADPNPGKGGFAVLREIDGKAQPETLGREDYTTNIVMEGRALLTAMTSANGENCEIHTDSQFWINVLLNWAPKWEANGWQKKGGIKNLELVQKNYRLYKKGNVRLVFVRGHVGTKNNELADYWAKRARDGKWVTDADHVKIDPEIQKRNEKILREITGMHDIGLIKKSENTPGGDDLEERNEKKE